MDDKMKAVSSDLQTQWQDHFHMRDQTWKVLQYSIIFFVGVVGLQMKVADKFILSLAYLAVSLTSALGVIIALHHRRRQKEKFEIIVIYERELGLYRLIAPVIEESRDTWTGKINASAYIVVMQLALCVVSIVMLVKALSS